MENVVELIHITYEDPYLSSSNTIKGLMAFSPQPTKSTPK